jgi:plasmid stabilization system protein ParE
MAFQVITKKRFDNKLYKLVIYLEKEWGQQVASDFTKKIFKRMAHLSNHPFTGKSSQVLIGIKSCYVTKHNRFYYKIIGNNVLIINMYDTRLNPKKNPYK